MKSSEHRAKMSNEAIAFWKKVFRKMNLLLKLMEACKPNRDIDDPEVRWVEDRIEYWDSDDRMLNKNEMLIANTYWIKYNGPINVKRS